MSMWTMALLVADGPACSRNSEGRRAVVELRPKTTLPRPSDVVLFCVWYGFSVRTLIRTTQEVLHWRV